MTKKAPMLEITLIKSLSNSKRYHKDTAEALGLSRREQTVTKPDTKSIRGMIGSIRHLVLVKEL